MPAGRDARQRLVRLFRRSAVADLAALRRALGTPSRTTVFRALSTVGYLTSASHAGKYYTLADVPRFDADGLWRHEGVLFSKDRTLRRTLVRLVDAAPQGHTHAELQERLRLRVQDTLRDLTRDREIDRVELERLFVYVSVQAAVARLQVARRREATESVPEPLAPLVVVEVLLEVIRAAGAFTAPRVVSRRLAARRVIVSPEQVKRLYGEHGISKKGRRSPSRRSRR